jgi:transposase
VWRAWRSDLPSEEGWPLIWLHSAVLALHQAHTRRERIERTKHDLERLKAWVESPRSRLRRRREIHERLRKILVKRRATRYLRVKVAAEDVHRFKQVGPGRPGKETKYRRTTRQRFTLTWHVDEKRIEQERRHDGMYPLLTNDRALTPKAAFEEHKRQPRLERRFCQLKNTFVIAPVFLKNAGRIEALFFLYALALIVEALIEREIRAAMEREKIPSLDIYPEERPSSRPTAPQILRLFANVEHHELRAAGTRVKTFSHEFTPIQKEVLRLLGVPADAFRITD